MPQEIPLSYDLIIIGAGPAGVEAALQAHKMGLSYLLIDKDGVGSLIKNTMENKKFFHQYGRNTSILKGDLVFPDRILGGNLVLAWKEQVKSLFFKSKIAVTSVSRANENFIVETSRGVISAKHIILASGTFEHPRELNIPGEVNNKKILYLLDYYNNYRGKRAIIVGGGNSAVETANYLATENDVIMLVRKTTLSGSVTPKNRADLEQFIKDGHLDIWYNSGVQKIAPDEVTIRQEAELIERPYDLLFIHIGFIQPLDFLKNIGVATHEGRAIFNSQTYESSIPGIFITGALTGADSVIESANQAYEIVHHIANNNMIKVI